MYDVAEQVVVVTRWEYIAFVFIAAVGVLQLVAATTRLKSLLFLRKPALTYPFSLILITGSFYWFFVQDDRIDTIMRHVGVEGSGQFYYFSIGTFFALVFTLALSSLISRFLRKTQGGSDPDAEGLDNLEDMSYWEAVKRSFRSKED
ncbi:hypothetical protein ACFLXE_02255 [Chloroflexota bacterium]